MHWAKSSLIPNMFIIICHLMEFRNITLFYHCYHQTMKQKPSWLTTHFDDTIFQHTLYILWKRIWYTHWRIISELTYQHVYLFILKSQLVHWLCNLSTFTWHLVMTCVELFCRLDDMSHEMFRTSCTLLFVYMLTCKYSEVYILKTHVDMLAYEVNLLHFKTYQVSFTKHTLYVLGLIWGRQTYP